MKKLFSLALLFVFLMSISSVVVYAVESSNRATPNEVSITEKDFATKIEILKQEYPNGQYWNRYNGTVASGKLKGTSKAGAAKCKCTKSCPETCSCTCGRFRLNGSDVAYQCHGYALLLAYKIFGSNINASSDWQKLTSLGSYAFYAGDVVRLNGTHTIFIYKVDGSKVYYTDANYNGPCKLNWEGETTVSKLRSSATYVRHLKGNTLKGVDEKITETTRPIESTTTSAKPTETTRPNESTSDSTRETTSTSESTRETTSTSESTRETTTSTSESTRETTSTSESTRETTNTSESTRETTNTSESTCETTSASESTSETTSTSENSKIWEIVGGIAMGLVISAVWFVVSNKLAGKEKKQ